MNSQQTVTTYNVSSFTVRNWNCSHVRYLCTAVGS